MFHSQSPSFKSLSDSVEMPDTFNYRVAGFAFPSGNVCQQEAKVFLEWQKGLVEGRIYCKLNSGALQNSNEVDPPRLSSVRRCKLMYLKE